MLFPTGNRPAHRHDVCVRACGKAPDEKAVRGYFRQPCGRAGGGGHACALWRNLEQVFGTGVFCLVSGLGRGHVAGHGGGVQHQLAGGKI